MKTLTSLLFVLTLLLPALTRPLSAAEPKVGDTVAAPWSDVNFYLATITAIADGNASVLYEDGDKGSVPLDKVSAVVKDATFAVGDHVLAAWKGARMFPGVVTAVSEAVCIIKWDDGDAPLQVPKTRMVHAR